MKKAFILAFVSLVLGLTACGNSDGSSKSSRDSVTPPEGMVTKDPEPREIDTDELKKKFPEYFTELKNKSIGVYVWQMAENSYQCVLADDSDGRLSDDKIAKMSKEWLAVEQAKAILTELGVKPEDVTVYPASMKFSSYYYEVNDEYRAKVKELFDQYPIFGKDKE